MFSLPFRRQCWKRLPVYRDHNLIAGELIVEWQEISRDSFLIIVWLPSFVRRECGSCCIDRVDVIIEFVRCTSSYESEHFAGWILSRFSGIEFGFRNSGSIFRILTPIASRCCRAVWRTRSSVTGCTGIGFAGCCSSTTVIGCTGIVGCVRSVVVFFLGIVTA